MKNAANIIPRLSFLCPCATNAGQAINNAGRVEALMSKAQPQPKYHCVRMLSYLKYTTIQNKLSIIKQQLFTT
ncbi:MAG: hypothetical protein EOO60_01905 [Hymenobacter sp.]|nr:MAG: hypothetical protein EOO60_01905 [Hymenobacter sp.]